MSTPSFRLDVGSIVVADARRANSLGGNRRAEGTVATMAGMATASAAPPLGRLLKQWRNRRHLSQLDLASEAGVSTRHVSFIETGRSQPSREMVLHLAEHLEVPLRERNSLLLAAGYAPAYRENDLDAPEMRPVRDALEKVLAAHEPYPAVVLDRGWNLVAANASVGVLTAGVSAELLAPPANVLRASLHPDGLAPRIRNFAEWSGHLLTRLHRQVLLTGDRDLAGLLQELRGYPGVPRQASFPELEASEKVFVPLRLADGRRELRFFSTVATFGTAIDVTLAELAIESFFPADRETAAALSTNRSP
jgi:transcriptional regulator with XRE-family HTH domain